MIIEFINQYKGTKIPVIYIGNPPILIGELFEAPSAAEIQPLVDKMLLEMNLKASFISRAIAGNKLIVLAHSLTK